MSSLDNKTENKTKKVIAICGIKNSGKTTLIRKLIPELINLGYRVATIKHDGHEFESDVPGTDSYYHQKAGAYATAVYSNGQFMITKRTSGITNEMLMEFFPEADLILIEGCKDCEYPKMEVVRSVNGNEPASNPKGRFLIVTDILDYETKEPVAYINDIDTITKAIVKNIERGTIPNEVNENSRCRRTGIVPRHHADRERRYERCSISQRTRYQRGGHSSITKRGKRPHLYLGEGRRDAP